MTTGDTAGVDFVVVLSPVSEISFHVLPLKIEIVGLFWLTGQLLALHLTFIFHLIDKSGNCFLEYFVYKM